MSKIPKIIHQIYYQGEAAIPQKFLPYRQTVLALHPNWEYYFWDEQQCRSFLQENYPWFLEVYDSYPHLIQRCDAIRYFLLYHYGGFYIDMDIEFIKPMDDLLEDYELIVSNGCNNAIIGSIPKHPLWSKVFQELDKRKSGISRKYNSLFVTMPRYVCYTTGPFLLKDCFFAEKYHEKNTVRLCPEYIFEANVLSEINGVIDNLDGNKVSYSIHNSASIWVPSYYKILDKFILFFLNQYQKIKLMAPIKKK
ncbi:hypothetical protein DSM106972_091730 [Dulcicalothrix desertica PCC 7102]|uniref:Glycosyl transferase n=1 Tax=Dulcicalothrix desertica PCC 7102 TaxID=232991 RepID=A0A433UME8_9CYAN|nr:glycosyltransferase [Dulcicalothrix desertica]RUS95013.1 hypothetical protein DSM106972_091730 [Dulcicalothrix desertica PCC 7102]TWH51411.1 Mannosyltransferase OCH1 and related enzymes [Dulcicalothrix desertica PCC 7102]